MLWRTGAVCVALLFIQQACFGISENIRIEYGGQISPENVDSQGSSETTPIEDKISLPKKKSPNVTQRPKANTALSDNYRITDLRVWGSPTEWQFGINLTYFPKITHVNTLKNGTQYFDILKCTFRPGYQEFRINSPFLRKVTVKEIPNMGVRVFFSALPGITSRTFLLPLSNERPNRIVIFLSRDSEPNRDITKGLAGAPISKILDKFYLEARSRIFTILSLNSNGSDIGQGTGFAYSNSGHILTNLHVVARSSDIFLKDAFGGIHHGTISRIHSGNLDVAEIISDYRGQPLTISSKSTQIGQKVYIIGSPLGFEGTLTDGIISAIRYEGSNQVFQISAPISPGSSGSPVFNEFGEVIGIATKKAVDGEMINFAIPIGSALDGLK